MNNNLQDINFVRWGTLSQRKGKAITNDGFHSAPTKFGLYAFPKFFDESFLVNWKYSDDKANKKLIDEKLKKMHKNVDEFWETLSDSDENLNLYEKLEHSIVKEKKRKDFKIIKYRGYVWHHFIEQSKSIKIKGSWVLDSYDDYIKCLKQYIHETAKCFFNPKDYMTNLGVKDNIINGVRRFFSKDMFEVYLPDKIK